MDRKHLPALPKGLGRGYSLRSVSQRLATKGLTSAVLKIPSRKDNPSWLIRDIAPEARNFMLTLQVLALVEAVGRTEVGPTEYFGVKTRGNSLRKLWAAGPNLAVVQDYIRAAGQVEPAIL